MRVSACRIASSAMRLPYSTCGLSHSSSGSLDELRDEPQRVAARQPLLDLALELRVEDARREHEAQPREHVFGQQLHALGQQAVMVDEALDRVEQAVAQAGLVGAAGRGRDQVDVALAHRAPSS